MELDGLFTRETAPIALVAVVLVLLVWQMRSRFAQTSESRFGAKRKWEFAENQVEYLASFVPTRRQGRTVFPSSLEIRRGCELEGFSLFVYPEDKLGPLVRAWGLSDRVLMRDAEVDRSFQIVCSHPELISELVRSGWRVGLLSFRAMGFESLSITQGVAAIRLSPVTMTDARKTLEVHAVDLAQQINAWVAKLTEFNPEPRRAIAGPLSQVHLNAAKKLRSTNAYTLIALAIIAVNVLALVAYTPVHFVSSFIQLEVVGLSLASLWLMMMRSTIRKWALSTKMLRMLATQWLVLALGVSYGGGLILNGTFPTSRQTAMRSVVMGKYTTRNKGRTSYWMTVASPDRTWVPWEDMLNTRVSAEDFDLIQPGTTHAIVITQPGILGVVRLIASGADTRKTLPSDLIPEEDPTPEATSSAIPAPVTPPSTAASESAPLASPAVSPTAEAAPSATPEPSVAPSP